MNPNYLFIIVLLIFEPNPPRRTIFRRAFLFSIRHRCHASSHTNRSSHEWNDFPEIKIMWTATQLRLKKLPVHRTSYVHSWLRLIFLITNHRHDLPFDVMCFRTNFFLWQASTTDVQANFPAFLWRRESLCRQTYYFLDTHVPNTIGNFCTSKFLSTVFAQSHFTFFHAIWNCTIFFRVCKRAHFDGTSLFFFFRIYVHSIGIILCASTEEASTSKQKRQLKYVWSLYDKNVPAMFLQYAYGRIILITKFRMHDSSMRVKCFQKVHITTEQFINKYINICMEQMFWQTSTNVKLLFEWKSQFRYMYIESYNKYFSTYICSQN